MVLVVKNPPTNAGDIRKVGLIPGLGQYPGGENGNPLQDSCLENPMDRGAWRAIVHRVTKNQTQLKRLNVLKYKEYSKVIAMYGRIVTGKELITNWTHLLQQGVNGTHEDSLVRQRHLAKKNLSHGAIGLTHNRGEFHMIELLP